MWSDYYNGVYHYVYTVPLPNDGLTILDVKVLNTEKYVDAYRAAGMSDEDINKI